MGATASTVGFPERHHSGGRAGGRRARGGAFGVRVPDGVDVDFPAVMVAHAAPPGGDQSS